MGILLDGVKYYPDGNTFGQKVSHIKNGNASETELELIQYAALFNLVMFDKEKWSPEKLSKLTQELTRLEEKLGIQYVFQPFELNENRTDLENRSPQNLDRDAFLKTIFKMHKTSLQRCPTEAEKFDSLSDLEKFEDTCYLKARTTGTILYPDTRPDRPVDTDNFLIQANSDNGNLIKVDLRKNDNSGAPNTHFLMQIMCGKSFRDSTTAKSKSYLTQDLYRLAASQQHRQYKTTAQTLDRDALRIIASRQRRERIQTMQNRLSEYLTNLIHPKENDNGTRT